MELRKFLYICNVVIRAGLITMENIYFLNSLLVPTALGKAKGFFILFIMKEIWKDIEGFEDYYQISSLGNVKRKEGSSHLKSKNLKMLSDKDGYHRVNLKVKQKTNSRIVHRLLAMAFIPNPENKPQVNHINGIKNDNRLENLEWVTLSENRVHAYATGLQNGLSRRGKKNNFVKLTEEQVKWVRENYAGDVRLIPRKERYKYWTAKKMAQHLNVTEGCVLLIINNKSWKHIQQ